MPTSPRRRAQCRARRRSPPALRDPLPDPGSRTARRGSGWRALPRRPRVRAREDLHLAQHMTEVFGVPTAAPAALHVTGIRNTKAGTLEDRQYLFAPRRLESARIHAVTTRGYFAVDVVGNEQLSRVPPQIVPRLLRPPVALVGPSAERHDPLRAVADMVPRLLERLGRNPREIGVAALLQRIHLQQRVDAEQKLPDDGEAEITLGELQHQRVAKVDRVAEIGERVLVSSLPFHGRRELEEQARLADQVERDVGEGDVLLEDRSMAAPLGQPVSEHESV